MGAPAARASELSRYWVRDCHDVTVLTGFPNHPTGVVPREYRPKMWRLSVREISDGVNVVRTWLLPFPNRQASERMLNYSSFAFLLPLPACAWRLPMCYSPHSRSCSGDVLAGGCPGARPAHSFEE